MKNKRKLLKLILLSISIIPTSLFSQKSFQDWIKEQQSALQAFSEEQNNYNNDTTLAYQNYLNQQEQQFQNYKNEIEQRWDEFRSSTKNTHVDYDEDLNARGSVDFEKGELEVEVLIDDTPDTKGLVKEEIGETKLEEKISQMVSSKADDDKPLLENQLETDTGAKVTKNNATKFAKEIVSNKPIKKKIVKSKDGKTRIKYSVTISLLPDHLETRAARFKNNVIEQSKRFEIDPALVLAIMHTESSFNPKARSPVPAYGLMQLVPKSGARDAYLYVYKKDKVLKADYLYVPRNNIELGCAYIKKMRSVYFKNIKNDQSAYYCTIAAYNTGPGNLAKAITGEKKLTPAINQINLLSPEKLYSKLINNLPYKESRNYLKTVNSRIKIYQ
jgi:membrane-bound lytic murein transglycosylase C